MMTPLLFTLLIISPVDCPLLKTRMIIRMSVPSGIFICQSIVPDSVDPVVKQIALTHRLELPEALICLRLFVVTSAVLFCSLFIEFG